MKNVIDCAARASWIEVVIDPGSLVFVSAVGAWEIETKKRSKKLDFDDDVTRLALEFDCELLSVDMAQATLAGSLDWSHRDPFDRMLAAQAIADDMLVVTADDSFKSAPRVRVL